MNQLKFPVGKLNIEASKVKEMWDNLNNARRSQRMAALCAFSIMVLLILPFPIGGQLGTWMNSSLAPEDEGSRFAKIAGQSDVTFDMDSTAIRTGVSAYSSYYVWKNSSGYTNYCNVTHTSGVVSVTSTSTAGNAITGNVSWAQMYPEYKIYFDYSAKDAYADNVARIRLYLSNLYVSGNAYARTITLSAGGVTLYETTLAKTDTDNYIDTNITVDVNDLRRAIINDGSQSYFKLEVTAQDTSLSFANSAMYNYDVTKLTEHDDGLFIAGVIAVVLVWAGIFLVQPKYSLPIGKKKSTKGGF